MPLNESVIEQLQKTGLAVVENWINPTTLGHLQSLFDELEFVPAKVGQGENLGVRPEVRGDSTTWVNHLLPPFKLLSTIEQLEDLRHRCNRELFLGLRDWELHLAKYPAGAFYKKHSDRHERTSRRVLSVILYLNESWAPTDGGELVIYDARNQEMGRVLPRGGTLVCFISSDFPHEVLPSQRERRSLTGWLLEGGSDVPAL